VTKIVTTQWSKEKVQKDKQRSAKYTHITKVRVTRTPIKTGCELRFSGSVSSSCSISDTRRVTDRGEAEVNSRGRGDKKLAIPELPFLFFMFFILLVPLPLFKNPFKENYSQRTGQVPALLF
jgi:hypothetical protein